jgi:hypothetical protein
MKIEDVPFTATIWSEVEAVEYPGTTGSAIWRTVQQGNLRVRMVQYSPEFVQDHWCARGQVMLLHGDVLVELGDGTEITFRQARLSRLGTI